MGEGEGGKIWENGIETCKISCMKRVASPGSMHMYTCGGFILIFVNLFFKGHLIYKSVWLKCLSL